MKSNPQPVRLRLAAKFEDLTEDDAGWRFSMWAQFYSVINDRGWFFFPGSFSKTIRDRANKDRVKVHDGHNFSLNASDTIGRVLSASETARGVRYQGFLGRPAAATAMKMQDGTLDENSVEVIILKADRIERPLEEVPDEVRPWVEITPDGTALVTGVREVKWLAVGIVAMSSQDRPALIEAPTAVSFQDLPVALSSAPWDPDAAAQRVAAWAVQADGATPGGADIVRLGRAHLVQMPGGRCFGQIADVEDGRLVVVPDSLEGAVGRVHDGLSDLLPDIEQRQAFAAAEAHLARYSEKILSRGLTRTPQKRNPEKEGAVLAPTALPGGAEPPPGTEPETGTHSDEGSTAAAAQLAKLAGRVKLLHLRHRAHEGVRTAHEPTSTGRKSPAAGPRGLG